MRDSWVLVALVVPLAATALPTISDNDFDPSLVHGASTCERYDLTCVQEAKKEGSDPSECYGVETCPKQALHNCFVAWIHVDMDDNDTSTAFPADQHSHPSGHEVKLMGCYLKSPDCHSQEYCTETSFKDNGRPLFCCCRGDMCNANFTWSPVLPPVTSDSPSTTTRPEPISHTVLLLSIVFLVIIMIAVLSVVIGYVYAKRRAARQMLNTNDSVEMTAAEMPEFQNLLDNNLGLIASGRYGMVWKAKLEEDKTVAVKVFALREKQSWETERDVYQLPRMSHDNILKFIGVNVVSKGLERDFWLITEYHRHGSLHDYLKNNSLSWDEMCRIGGSMARGLAYLHEELPKRGTEDMKLAVAHRDFKSKNVLIKADLTACIGDFGLALIFEPGKAVGDTHGQIGTTRYMAPEVLEGAITFSRDSFLRIDMYACGLVLWELASRCSGLPSIIPQEYKLPFDAEVPQPNLEQMKELVVNKKLRPVIQSVWEDDSGMAEWVTMIRDCWDQDAEARLSASNVRERIKEMCEVQRGDLNHDTTGGSSDSGLTTEQQLNCENTARNNNANDDDHETTPLIIGNGGGNNSATTTGGLNNPDV